MNVIRLETGIVIQQGRRLPQGENNTTQNYKFLVRIVCFHRIFIPESGGGDAQGVNRQLSIMFANCQFFTV